MKLMFIHTALLYLMIANTSIAQTVELNWLCHYPSSIEISSLKSHFVPNLYDDTLHVHLVISHALYIKWNSNIKLVHDNVHQLFNSVSEIYSQEGIPLKLTYIDIETKNSTFQSITDALFSIKDMNKPKGNMTLLLTDDSQIEGGIAFTGGVCDRSKAFGVCQITNDFTNYPSYTKDVHVLAHEIGHILGSAHTHDCVWGPNKNKAIDGCSINSCDNFDYPEEGGTIMSYCQDSPQGVVFSLGFGKEPGDLIRFNYLNCKSVLGTSCSTAITISENITTLSTGKIDQGFSARDRDGVHARWYKFYTPDKGSFTIHSCDQGIDSRLNIYMGPCDSLSLLASSDDDCHSGEGYNLAAALSDVAIDASTTIWIEWTDTWSNDSFDFTFEYTPSEIKDPCGNMAAPIANVADPSIYYSDNEISYGGTIEAHGSLMLASPKEIVLTPGFEIMNYGDFEVYIGDCSSVMSNN